MGRGRSWTNGHRDIAKTLSFERRSLVSFITRASTQHYIKDPFKHAHSGIYNDNNLDPRHRLTTLDTLSHHDHINNDLATTTTLIRPRQIRRHSTIHTIPRSSPWHPTHPNLCRRTRHGRDRLYRKDPQQRHGRTISDRHVWRGEALGIQPCGPYRILFTSECQRTVFEFARVVQSTRSRTIVSPFERVYHIPAHLTHRLSPRHSANSTSANKSLISTRPTRSPVPTLVRRIPTTSV